MKENKIAIIAAMAANRVIGRAGKIPWDLPEDLEHFKRLTMGHVVIMGRRTYEEIGRPLPERITYVVSSTITIDEENCYTVTSLPEAIKHAERNYVGKKIFLCGGAQIYKEGMAMADEIYLTLLEEEIEGDVYFPEIGEEFRIVGTRQYETFTLVTYRRQHGSTTAPI